MSAYSDYITAVRRLLHDANAQFWSDAELLDYINQARNRVVRDTGCYRNLQTRNLVASTETYTLQSGFTIMPVYDVVNLTVDWGNSRISLAYLPWSRFNAMARYWRTMIGRPAVFSVYSYSSVFVQPMPDQTYSAEWDTVCRPDPIIDATTVEVLPEPFTEPVKFYAARLAKMKEQSYGEADNFNQIYLDETRRAIGSAMTRRVLNPYTPR